MDCTLGDTLKMLYAYFRQFVRTPYPILGGSPAASATPFAPISSTVNLGDGSVIQFAVKAGQNDPFKKPPPPGRRKYDPVGDWTPADGCPDGCSARIGSYDSLITHRTRCPNKRKPQK